MEEATRLIGCFFKHLFYKGFLWPVEVKAQLPTKTKVKGEFQLARLGIAPTPITFKERTYSELPLIWTSEMWPPLYSGHSEKSPNRLHNTNSIQVPPWNEATPLIRTLWLVPRVAGLEGVHCTSGLTVSSVETYSILQNSSHTTGSDRRWLRSE